MRKVATFVAIIALSLSPLTAQNAPVQSAPERKVIARVEPTYPELARKMRIQGIVKVEAVVKPNGTVKSLRVLGGSPILVEAAADAVKRWKFQPAQSETTEVVQVAFANE